MNAFRLRSPSWNLHARLPGHCEPSVGRGDARLRHRPTSGATQDLRLVPFPKSVALETGRFSFQKSLTLEISDGQGELPAQLLNGELQRAGLRGARVSRLKSAVPAFRMAVKQARPGPAGSAPANLVRELCPGCPPRRNCLCGKGSRGVVLWLADALPVDPGQSPGGHPSLSADPRLAFAALALLPGRPDPRSQFHAGHFEIRGVPGLLSQAEPHDLLHGVSVRVQEAPEHRPDQRLAHPAGSVGAG